MSHFYDHILAGFVAGASSVAISHPLDTVKVRLQTNKNYKNTVDCFVKTLNGEGVAGFYKGMAFPLASAAVYNACVFGVYKNVLELMTRNQTERESYTQVAIASSVAGAASVTIGTPVDLIKIKLQVQTNGTVRNIGGRSARKLAAAARLKNVLSESHRGISNVALLGGRGRGGSAAAAVVGPVQCAMDIVQREGVSGLYRGATAMLARDIPGYAIYFVPYEAMVRWMQLRSGDESFGAAATCAVVSGGVAGTISWGLMHPVDTVKSRLQADTANRYSGFVHCARDTIRREGVESLFRGVGVNSLRGFPQSAALFLMYEMTIKCIDTARSSPGDQF